MHRHRPTAGKRLLALLAALSAVCGGSAAHAQADPFALPEGVTAQSAAAVRSGPGLSEIAVDGDTRARMVDLAWRGDVLTIDADSARVAGLPVPDSAEGKIPLASLTLAHWSFDRVKQRLDVQLMRQSDGANLIDMTQAGRTDGESAPITAFRVNYDLTATLAKGRSGAAGQIEASLVRGNVALISSFQLATGGTASAVRLDSAVQVLLPRQGMAATLGDLIGVGGQSQRALRLGGFQIASDYSLRPDLVTSPLPSFTGQVSVPTGVDVIVADQRYQIGEVQPGEFTVRNVPVNVGRGEVAVIVRDALGREMVQSTRFYTSRDLLAPGLSQFAVNAGFVRRRYGLRSNDYGPAAASAFYRRGISRNLTLEATAEWTSGLVNAGARGDLVLGNVALATLEARFSHDSGSGLSGTLLNLALESTGRHISGRIGAILPSPGYRDAASKIGDPLPPRQFMGQVSFNLGRTTQFQLSASRQTRQYDPRYPGFEPRVDVVNASFRLAVSRAIDFHATVGYRNAERRAYTAWAGISIQLGRDRNAQLSGSGGTGAPTTANAGFYRRESDDRRIGYGVEASYGATNRVSASVAWRSPYGRVESQVEQVGGRFGLRANARGTVLLVGGAVFARNQTGGSYALVRTGRVGGVTVLRENREAGKTAHNGLLLIENVPAQVPLSFDIDPEKLPADALARASLRRVIVPRHAVGLVALDVVRFVPRMIRLIGIDGTPLAAGSVVVAQPSGERTMVGFDGVIDFNAASDDRWISLVRGDDALCFAEIDPLLLAGAAGSAETPGFACRPGAPAALTRIENQARRPGARSRRR